MIAPNKLVWLATILITFSAFSIPFLTFHQGLPTGDSQKAIIFAQQIIENKSLPDYSVAIPLLNRDPIDFATPALHLLTALIMLLPAPLTSVGLFSIAASLAVALTAAAITQTIYNKPWLPFLTFVLVLTNFRFLRYLREPGYHYQNIFGELFLWALLLIILSLFRKPDKKFILQITLLILLVPILALFHQFSAFLAVFTLTPPLIFLLNCHQKYLQKIWQKNLILSISFLSLAIVFILAIGIFLNVPQKLTHLFTTTPHLISLSPNLFDYPRILGTVFIIFGLAGLVLTIKKSPAFSSTTIILFILSQGPRFGIDIPPVRTLLYSVIPLSITASYFLWHIFNLYPKKTLVGIASKFTVILTLLSTSILSITQAYQLTHASPTNSTLTRGQLLLMQYINSGAILVDDSNRRSTSWFALSRQPTFTRIADLRRQAAESTQSPLRQEIYLKQLDYEKIYNLGNHPIVTQLLAQYNIHWIIGEDHSTTSNFLNNPNLKPIATADNLTLFSVTSLKENDRTESVTDSWLLKPSTLVNDIGDREDTFSRLPVSLQTSRLSNPINVNQLTYRHTTAPHINLHFNLETFAFNLIDQDFDKHPDSSMDLLIKIIDSPKTSLSITLPNKKTIPVTPNQPINIPASQLTIDDKGFIILTLNNPQQSQLNIDLIALGSSHVP